MYEKDLNLSGDLDVSIEGDREREVIESEDNKN
jgi:hypothetical protein